MLLEDCCVSTDIRCKLYISLYYNCAAKACSLLTSDHNLKYTRISADRNF